MQEILPGVFHWITFHEGIKYDIDSYYIEATEPAVLIDPRVPADELEWFDRHKTPEHVFLTNRHHYRHSDQFENAFRTKVWCHAEGLHEFTAGEKVEAYQHGDQLPGGILALEVGVLCPEETALLILASGGVLAIGDAAIRYGDDLAFVPDQYMGNDPAGVKRGLREALMRVVEERDFDTMLFAHGKPVVGDAKSKLRAFLEDLDL
jgi:hypothetical protein